MSAGAIDLCDTAVMRARILVVVALALAITACGGSSPSAVTAATGLKLTQIGRFNQPVYLTSPPGDTHRLFVVEKTGRIRIVKDGSVLGQPFLSLAGRVSSSEEQGLLSMAFAPDYSSSGLFYVDYTDLRGNSHVVEYHVSSNPDVADAGSARQVLFQSQPEANHNGGLVLFGPDKLLYIGFGDGGAADDVGPGHNPRIGNGQDLGTWLGKILRIDPRRSGNRPYTVPRSNPFVHRRGARPEIYADGLRNPWRFAFDGTDMVIADVGQNAEEEVDFAPHGSARGANYGWKVWEGRLHHASGSAPRAKFPNLVYDHTGGRCSITGGYVVRDPRLTALRGRYVYGDFCDGKLHSARLRPGRVSNRSLGLTVPGLSSFGVDQARQVYALSLNGPVYRLDPH
jgi:glucose/arabinose dehydrogenase